MFNTIGPSFTLKWKPLDRTISGSYNNSNYYDTNFNFTTSTNPTWPLNNIWNNIWYKSEPDYYATSNYESYVRNVPVSETINYYNVYTYAESYIYSSEQYNCCWCVSCAPGWYDTGSRNGQWGECGICQRDHYSNEWWYQYYNYKTYNIYNRYTYLDHNVPLQYVNTVYRDYSSVNGAYNTRWRYR
jgi:hypothetical protein